jgi:hypothetical protein
MSSEEPWVDETPDARKSIRVKVKGTHGFRLLYISARLSCDKPPIRGGGLTKPLRDLMEHPVLWANCDEVRRGAVNFADHQA